MTTSLYSILNVSPEADPAVIEAAYKALMKKYHPDALVGQPASTQSQAAEINRAFQVLRDPERRAQYDSQEQARMAAFRPGNQNPAMHDMYFQQMQPPKRSRAPALVLITLLAALIFYVWQMTEATGQDQFASAIPAQPASVKDQMLQATGISSAFPPVNPINIERAVAESRRVNQKMGLMGLSAYSQDCFASQGRSAKLVELDFCVAFDNAASAYDANSARAYSLPELPRFQPREMMSRHMRAAKTISDDDAWARDRLAEVKSLTADRLGASETPAPTRVAAAAAASATQTQKPQDARVVRSPPRQAAPRQAAPRQQSPRQPHRREKRASDTDFLERQGYIY